MVVLLTFINCCSVSWTNRVQYIFTIAKVLALILIILIGCIQLAQGLQLDTLCGIMYFKLGYFYVLFLCLFGLFQSWQVTVRVYGM